jgi:hypothetical protein
MYTRITLNLLGSKIRLIVLSLLLGRMLLMPALFHHVKCVQASQMVGIPGQYESYGSRPAPVTAETLSDSTVFVKSSTKCVLYNDKLYSKRRDK